MMSFFNVGVDDFELWTEHGTAAGVKTWSESRVTGGGGHNNRPVNISTHVTTRNEFFLVDGNKESAISLTGAVPLRDGQPASVIYVKRKEKKSGYAVLFKNHASNDERVFNGVIDAAGGVGCGMLIAAVIAGAFVGFLLSTIFGTFTIILGALGFGAVVVMRMLKLKATNKQLIENARALASARG